MGAVPELHTTRLRLVPGTVELFDADPDEPDRLAALLGVAELGILLTIVDRVLERELIAIGFVLFNNAAHASMLYALLAIPGPGGLLSLFCALMLGGEIIKLRWLHQERPPLRQLTLMAAQAFVVAYAAIYLVALVFWELAT